ncbi:MAG: imidazole glycerol phosphate synthase [Pseudomonadota bacterium]|jgi:glutamine amidotransferase
MAAEVAIIDSGGANLASLVYALQRMGASAVVTADAQLIRAAPRVLLPGVGSAGNAMQRLRAAGLHEVIPQLTQPLLGICLGMQLLFEASAEGDGGPTACLGILPGRVERLRASPQHPVPHMGWNTTQPVEADPLFAGLSASDYFYFVHSYRAPLGAFTLARSEYSETFSSAVRHRNFRGVQFHPERSAGPGARLLANFLKS